LGGPGFVPINGIGTTPWRAGGKSSKKVVISGGLKADITDTVNVLDMAYKHSSKQGVKMEKICWKEEYSVGVEKFDRQHQHLFEIVNKLAGRTNSPEDSELVSEILSEMANYAREHFTDEETLMQAYDYPEIELHKKQHTYFIDTTAELTIGFINDKQSAGDEIAEFLSLWWTTHILKWDMKYKDFFKAKIHAGAAVSG
jgi:hemerythrin